MAGQDPPYENGLLIGRGGSAPLPTSPRAMHKGRGWMAQRIRRRQMRSFRRIAKRRRAPSNRRPGGRRTGGARFFDAAGCRIEKSRQTCRRQICLGTESFLWWLSWLAPMVLAPVSSTGQALRVGYAVRAARGAVRQRKWPAQSAEALQLLLMGIATLNPSYSLSW